MAISTIKNPTAPIPITGITAVNSLSITDNSSYRIGKLCVINVRLNVDSATQVSGVKIFWGLPKGKTSLGAQSGFSAALMRVGQSAYSGSIANDTNDAFFLSPGQVISLSLDTSIWIHAVYIAE